MATATQLVLCKLLPNKVALPGQPAYHAAEDAYYSTQAEELSPACMVFPESSGDVARTVQTLVAQGTKFAVRGGGHTSNAHAANIDDGVTINLRHLNQVTINHAQQTVSIGGGAKWAEVYPVLDAAGLATSGGRVADVGVGGLTTGGGISFFSGRKGLVCDNVINFGVVIADGTIIEANAEQHADLWIALRGGSGSNFGIVTRLDIRTFEQGKFFGGVTVTPGATTIEAQLEAYSHLLQTYDPNATIIMSISWQAPTGVSIFSNLEYTQDDPNPAALKPFLQIQPQYINTMRISTLADFAVEAGKYSANGSRMVFATTSFGGGLRVLKQVHQLWNDSIAKVESIAGSNWSMVIQPFPPHFSAQTKQLGGNSLGLEPTDEPLTLFLLAYKWSNASDDAAIGDVAKNLMRDIDAATIAAGAYSKYKYLNYAADYQNPLAGYGQPSLVHLRAVSRKYDPNQIFQRLVPGGFKVSTA